MIKFFRHIRQRLLTENKFNRYLLYAIGEIILVVIGILIALGINYWNQVYKDLNKEQNDLLQIHNENEKNLKQLDQKISTRNEIIQASKKLLLYIDDPVKVSKDSVLVAQIEDTTIKINNLTLNY